MDPAISRDPEEAVGTGRKTTHRYGSGYALVANTVIHMTPDQPRLAYDDMATPAEMHADCEEVGRHLGLERSLARAAQAATEPPPSIHFEDFPREVPKPEIRVSEAAQRIANALELHLG